MAGTLLLVALPPSGVTLVTLRGGQSIHVQPLEDSPHPRRADIDVVVALEVHPDLQRAEVVMLAQVDDLLDDVGMGDRRAVQRSAGAVLEALQALVFVSALPPVEDVAADAVVAPPHAAAPPGADSPAGSDPSHSTHDQPCGSLH